MHQRTHIQQKQRHIDICMKMQRSSLSLSVTGNYNPQAHEAYCDHIKMHQETFLSYSMTIHVGFKWLHAFHLYSICLMNFRMLVN